MIDFHTHLDLYPNALEVAKVTSDKDIFTLAVTTSPRAWIATSRVLGASQRIKIALGLHPEIAMGKASERELLLDSVRQAEYIGETGLDGSSRHRESFNMQKLIFEALLKECSIQGGRIMSIHSRGAVTQVLDLLERYPDAGTPVLHWFSGTKAELVRAINRGCWFSFGPAGTVTKSGREVLSMLPLARLLPESDGPFGKTDGQPVMPWQAGTIVSQICSFRRLSHEQVNNQFVSNLKEILRLNRLTLDS